MNETTTTAPTLSVPVQTLRKAAIVGTAGTWKLCPFNDPTLEVYGLNDLYMLGMDTSQFKGWFDLHPFHYMVFRSGRTVNESDVQPGQYIRPSGHLEWLRSRPFPIYVQELPKQPWPNARLFPRDDIMAKYGPYFSSTPAWMLAWMIEQGYQEIQIFGIHLATQWEYMRQRPNFEFLLGVAAARGIRIVIPNRAPIMRSPFVYAYEQKPEVPVERVQRKIHETKVFGKRLHAKVQQTPWYRPLQKKALKDQLAVVEAEVMDARLEIDRMQVLQQVG